MALLPLGQQWSPSAISDSLDFETSNNIIISFDALTTRGKAVIKVCYFQSEPSECQASTPSMLLPTKQCNRNGFCESVFHENGINCPGDCLPGYGSCGDGVCSANENAASCPRDCSTNSNYAALAVSASPSVCGDGICKGPESCVTCPQDCAVSWGRGAIGVYCCGTGSYGKGCDNPICNSKGSRCQS